MFVEAMPAGDTLLRSRDPSGRFFSCWTVPERGGKVERGRRVMREGGVREEGNEDREE